MVPEQSLVKFQHKYVFGSFLLKETINSHELLYICKLRIKPFYNTSDSVHVKAYLEEYYGQHCQKPCLGLERHP